MKEVIKSYALKEKLEVFTVNISDKNNSANNVEDSQEIM
jgi:hypothetical protein